MGKIDTCREQLRSMTDWIPFLLAESGLPGPRANLELMHAVAAEGDAALFDRLIGYDRPEGTTGTPDEFLVVCGLAGLGKLLAGGDRSPLPTLQRYASHFQWRLREGGRVCPAALGRVGPGSAPRRARFMDDRQFP